MWVSPTTYSNANVSKPCSGNPSVSEPHTRNVNVSEAHTQNVNASEPHTRNLNVSEPHTRNVNVSEPHRGHQTTPVLALAQPYRGNYTPGVPTRPFLVGGMRKSKGIKGLVNNSAPMQIDGISLMFNSHSCKAMNTYTFITHTLNVKHWWQECSRGSALGLSY